MWLKLLLDLRAIVRVLRQACRKGVAEVSCDV